MLAFSSKLTMKFNYVVKLVMAEHTCTKSRLTPNQNPETSSSLEPEWELRQADELITALDK